MQGHLLRKLAAVLIGIAVQVTLVGSCAQRPPIEGARCDCPKGFICVAGACRKDACPCPEGFTCTAEQTCTVNAVTAPDTSPACRGVATPLTTARYFPLFPQQYQSAFSQLTGLAANEVEMPAPPYRGLAPFATVSEGWIASDLQVDVFRRNAERGAARVVDAILSRSSCSDTEGSSMNCMLTFAAQAFRRPLEKEEQTELEALVQTAHMRFGAREAIRLAAYAVLQSPKFLYRSELGPLLAPQVGDKQLTSHEIAAALSFLLTDGPPDAELLQVAETLRTAEARAEQAQRLLATNAAHRKVETFFMQLLGMDTLPSHPQADQAGFQALMESMKHESSMFLERHIWTPGTRFSTLFTTHETFVDARLAAHYGLSLPQSQEGFQLVSIPERQGLLSRGRFLVAHPNPPGRLPVARGRAVKGRLKCEPMVAPELPISVRLEPISGATARQRLNGLGGGGGVCAGCHADIGQLTLGLEQFDELGRHRTLDQGEVIDTRVKDAAYGTFDHTMALAVAISESEAGQLCFVRQILTFALDADVEGGLEGDCLIERLHRKWKAHEFHVPALLTEIVKDDVFITRRFER